MRVAGNIFLLGAIGLGVAYYTLGKERLTDIFTTALNSNQSKSTIANGFTGRKVVTVDAEAVNPNPVAAYLLIALVVAVSIIVLLHYRNTRRNHLENLI